MNVNMIFYLHTIQFVHRDDLCNVLSKVGLIFFYSTSYSLRSLSVIYVISIISRIRLYIYPYLL